MHYECLACLLLAKEKFFDIHSIFFKDKKKLNSDANGFIFKENYKQAL